ncbi:xyloside xylosyltransferase 1 [Episyrphus balteatus]|uniref:xyloside xylosyltransferase 1 n=1 Tax=Episyrphus balteatus TaxID=286459 RepID=UPI002484F9BE|nr:xyloside xylosyltransferase 1 [Episyrphus balteatus]
MNKILLLLIIASGFLVIFYANSEFFSRKSLFALFQGNNNAASVDNKSNDGKYNDISQVAAGGGGPAAAQPLIQHRSNNSNSYSNSNRVKYISWRQNETSLYHHPHQHGAAASLMLEHHIFVIYTKENYQLQQKFELFARSLLKFATIKLHLHIITDSKSESSAEEILKQQLRHYKKSMYYTLYDVHECAERITDIVQAMMPFFSSNPSSYYSDALFYLSLGLHRLAEPHIERAILIDCDVVFRADVRLLFDEFERFSPENLFGLSPELTPVYRHILYRYRANYPNTNFGSSYYPSSAALGAPSLSGGNKHKHNKHIKHGYPGLNSGVVMLHLRKIRLSQLYQENLKEVNVRKMANKYSFKGHLGDQDFYTLLGYEFPSLIYRLDCVWNRQLCTWWKDHGYSEVFDTYFHCEGKIRLYHGNCNTRVPE